MVTLHDRATRLHGINITSGHYLASRGLSGAGAGTRQVKAFGGFLIARDVSEHGDGAGKVE